MRIIVERHWKIDDYLEVAYSLTTCLGDSSEESTAEEGGAAATEEEAGLSSLNSYHACGKVFSICFYNDSTSFVNLAFLDTLPSLKLYCSIDGSGGG